MRKKTEIWLSVLGLLPVIAVSAANAETVDSSSDAAWARAVETEQLMTATERVVMTSGIVAYPNEQRTLPKGAVASAGYVEGVERLNIPALLETDAGLGVSWALGLRGQLGATALPSGMALGSTWNPALAHASGRMIGGEARAKGFNVLLGGGVNLIRDPRGGRNFEYLSEDPLLSGVLGGQSIAGIQSNNIIATVKHFAFNNQETGRKFANVEISEDAAHESELLAFKIAIDIGKPGSVMCGYNKVNGDYACNSDWLLNRVLKQSWGYKGFVMSDWGAVYGPGYAWSGLDQQSGREADPEVYLADRLLNESAGKPDRVARITDMNRRILYAIYANGLDDRQKAADAVAVDHAANARIAQDVAEQGIVLLRNRNGALPLPQTAKHIAVIGGFADIGVLSGGGSSQVHGDGGPAATVPGGGKGFFNGWEQYQRGTPPLEAIRKRAGSNVRVSFRTGNYISEAVAEARKADAVILFANQWQTEGRDSPDLSLPRGQDALIEAVSAANPNTIVVLQTGSAVLMPWLDKTAAVLEAWYPGVRGGEAIAGILFGDVNPSGRLPVTFPSSLSQLPRPVLDGQSDIDPDKNGAGDPGQTLTIDYNIEGADLGYRWNARQDQKALFPFGFGLSYSEFETSSLTSDGSTAWLTVKNTGPRDGATVVQLYLVARNGMAMKRLLGFERVNLEVGETREIKLAIDARLLADWRAGRWELKKGEYRLAVGDNAEALATPITVQMRARSWRE